jgi:hypothetical protein
MVARTLREMMHNNNVAIGKRTVTNMAVWNAGKDAIGERTVTICQSGTRKKLLSVNVLSQYGSLERGKSRYR